MVKQSRNINSLFQDVRSQILPIKLSVQRSKLNYKNNKMFHTLKYLATKIPCVGTTLQQHQKDRQMCISKLFVPNIAKKPQNVSLHEITSKVRVHIHQPLSEPICPLLGSYRDVQFGTHVVLRNCLYLCDRRFRYRNFSH